MSFFVIEREFATMILILHQHLAQASAVSFTPGVIEKLVDKV
jgi:hypothetical protein